MKTSNLKLVFDTTKIERAIKGSMPQGRLRDSVRVESKEEPGKVVLTLTALDYFKYYDNGRGPGKFPPPPKITDWVKRNFTVNQKQLKTLSFLIGRKIATKGIEGKHIIDKLKFRYDWEVKIEELESIK